MKRPQKLKQPDPKKPDTDDSIGKLIDQLQKWPSDLTDDGTTPPLPPVLIKEIANVFPGEFRYLARDALRPQMNGSIEAALMLADAMVPGMDFVIAKINGGMTISAEFDEGLAKKLVEASTPTSIAYLGGEEMAYAETIQWAIVAGLLKVVKADKLTFVCGHCGAAGATKDGCPVCGTGPNG